MTSTLGFEALLRGKPVTCLGMPFYAGWGLTRDLAPAPPPPAREATLAAAFAHAALIAYPAPLRPAQRPALPGRSGRRAAGKGGNPAAHAAQPAPGQAAGPVRRSGVALALRGNRRRRSSTQDEAGGQSPCQRLSVSPPIRSTADRRNRAA